METKPIASGLGRPPAANPVMDVVSPPPTEQTKQPAQTAEADPLDKLAADDQAEQAARTPQQDQKHEIKAAPEKHAAKASGTGLAIAATVIIVLGLAALTTYAYLQTAK